MNRIKINHPFGFTATIFSALLLCCYTVALPQQTTQSYPVVGMPGYKAGDNPQGRASTRTTYRRPASSLPKWRPPATPLRIASTYQVTNVNDAGDGSLRKAIDSANTNPGLDVINFNIAGGGAQTITLHSALPTITGPVMIDGWTQPGFAGTPIIELDGQSAGTNINGLVLTGGNSRVRGLVINRFTGAGGFNGFGIVLDIGGGNTIEGNYIGTNVAGTTTLPNTGDGIGIFGSSTKNRIGDTTAQTRNIISGNSTGVSIATGSSGQNLVRGNYIGLDASGTVVLGNSGNGVYIDAQADTIGGLASGARNIISGSSLPAVFIGLSATGTLLQGNFVGTDVTGNLRLGNLQYGVYVDSAPNVIIGDSIPAGRNIISGNALPGVYIYGATATGIKILGNYIGTNASGTTGIGNGNGIVIDGAYNNTIGGTAPGARNVVSGNPFPGIFIKNGASGNRIINNYVGTNAAGSDTIANSAGIVIDNSPGNIIGGATAEEGNLISGNLLYGIQIRNAGATGNSIRGNFIGTDLSGTSNLGNGWDGIIINASQDTVISNVIAFNHGCGVYDSSGIKNQITQNSIFSNAGLGIDLAPRGLARNDSLDGSRATGWPATAPSSPSSPIRKILGPFRTFATK